MINSLALEGRREITENQNAHKAVHPLAELDHTQASHTCIYLDADEHTSPNTTAAIVPKIRTALVKRWCGARHIARDRDTQTREHGHIGAIVKWINEHVSAVATVRWSHNGRHRELNVHDRAIDGILCA